VKTYFDSSALVKIYVSEQHSDRVRREVVAARQVPVTRLHVLEIANALRVLTDRSLLTEDQSHALLDQFADDRQAQRLADASPDWGKVFHEAVQLSARDARNTLCRSLDVLHVALAIEIGCTRFVTGDPRQLAVARASGLKVLDIRESR
jgi:predicted nucleic acid-binding protein